MRERLDLHPSHKAVGEAVGLRATLIGSNGTIAIGALAVGAASIGALAIGRMAIGRLTVRRAHFGRLRVDELEVGSLLIDGGRGAADLLPATGGRSGQARLAAGSSKLSHVDLVVTSLERSLPFYLDLLGPIGWSDHDTIEGERGEDVHYISVPGSGVAAIGLRQAQSDAHPVPYDRYAPGVHHVCIDVPSRAEVDERAKWVRTDGRGELLSAGAERDYTPGYYSAFLADPDGIKLELLHRPGYWATVGGQ